MHNIEAHKNKYEYKPFESKFFFEVPWQKKWRTNTYTCLLLRYLYNTNVCVRLFIFQTNLFEKVITSFNASV